MSPVTRADHRRVAPGPRSATDGPAAGTADLVLLRDPRITAIPVRDRGVSPSTSPWWGSRWPTSGRRRPKPRPRAGTAGSPPGPRRTACCHEGIASSSSRAGASHGRTGSDLVDIRGAGSPGPSLRDCCRGTQVDQPLRLTCGGGATCERRRRRLTLAGPGRPGGHGGPRSMPRRRPAGARAARAHRDLADPARSNRALLARVLRLVGLVNYPTEWWHWSFGDRYWAWSMGERSALWSRRPSRSPSPVAQPIRADGAGSGPLAEPRRWATVASGQRSEAGA